MRPYAIRFVFGAGASVIAGLMGIVLGPVVGGVFLAFPAILPATLTLLERDKGNVVAVGDARGALAGALGLIAFAAVIVTLGHHTATIAAIGAALVAWIMTSMAAYAIGVGVARLLRLERYPPEVPVSVTRRLIDTLRDRNLSIVVVDAGAGGALGAVLAEAPHARATVKGAIVAGDAQAACDLVGVQGRCDVDGEHTAVQLATRARERWRADIALALVGAEGDRPTSVETFRIAVATPHDCMQHTFEARRGREGNWGHAVHVALRVTCDVARDEGVRMERRLMTP